MSKPTLSQFAELVQEESYHLWINKNGKRSFTPCHEAVERFGNVEVQRLGYRLSPLPPYEPSNEFKVMIEVFI